MLNLDSAPDVMREIRDAEKLRDLYLACWKKILARWVSCNLRSDAASRPTLENYIHSYTSLVLPQMVFQAPYVMVSPEINADDTPTATAMEGMLNCWMKRTEYKRNLKRMATSMILGWGVTHTGYGMQSHVLEGAAGAIAAANPEMPFNRTILIGNHFVDSQCSGYDTRRFEGHCFDVDIADLANDEHYDQSQVALLTPNQANRIRPDSPFTDKPEWEASRKRATLYEVWVPEAKVILTVGQTGQQGGVFLRKEEYVGPDDGPYNLWGAWEVPGQIYPFSPIAASFDQFEDLNIHAEAAQRSARSYKKFGVYNKLGSEDGKAIQTVKHGQMVGVNNFDSFKEAEIGGISAQQIQTLSLLKERLDQNMGFGATQRGVSNGDTATANNLMQGNTDLRIQWLVQGLIDSCAIDLRKVGWFFWNSDSLVTPITIQDRQTGKPVSGHFYGGQFDSQFLQGFQGGQFAGQIDARWVDYHLQLNPESMVKISDPVRQKRAQDEWALVNGMSTMFMQVYGAPALGIFNWRRMLDRYGEAFNEKNYSAIVLSAGADQMLAPDRLAMQQGMSFQDQLRAAHGGGPPQPQQPMLPQPQSPQMPPMAQPPIMGGPPQAGAGATGYGQLLAGAQAGVR